MARVQGMVFLSPENMIIREDFGSRLLQGVREPTIKSACDFDGVTFQISISKEEIQNYSIHFSFPFTQNILSLGGQEFLDSEFPGLQIQPAVGYDIAIQINMDAVPDSEKNELLSKVSKFRVLFSGSPLFRVFCALEEKNTSAIPPMELKCYQKDSIYIVPGTDRVIVIFSLDFDDETDQSLLDVFMESFSVMQRSVNNSPPCSYSKNIPLELQNSDIFNGECKNGFISFAIFPNHIAGPKKFKVISLLINFRSYLKYHIKCTKSYLHVRMRNKVDSWLQVLNRAKHEEEKEKRTATGKTFNRVA